MVVDLLIENARIVDGTGSPWWRGSVAVRDGRIVAVGCLEDVRADVTVDAEDRYLTPGFVDAHVHADLALLNEPTLEAATLQGVTAHVIGQDGISYAPASGASNELVHEYFAAVNGRLGVDLPGSSVAEFLERFDRRVAANVAYLVPHGTVRLEVVGTEDRPATEAEKVRMAELVENAMREGAVGVSTGLDYIPCRYADTEELVVLARAAARRGGVFVAHMRGYGPRVRAGMDEMVRVAVEAPAPIHVSHYNVPADLGLQLVDEARSRGVDVTYDLYPYLAGSSTLMLWLPNDLHVGSVPSILAALRTPEGRRRAIEHFESGVRPLDGVRFSHLERPQHARFLGMFVVDAAKAAGKPLAPFVVDLLIDEELRPGIVAFDSPEWRNEGDLRKLMRHPAHMVGSDGIYVGDRPHPRGWGAFARTLATYVRDEAVLVLEDAVRRMTSFPARRFGLVERGVIAPGFYADLALFDLSRVTEHATYDQGRAVAAGMDGVWVNGSQVVADGATTGALPGRSGKGAP